MKKKEYAEIRCGNIRRCHGASARTTKDCTNAAVTEGEIGCIYAKVKERKEHLRDTIAEFVVETLRRTAARIAAGRGATEADL